jgi:hypothetical protein
MNHCIIGGVGDGDSGEDAEMSSEGNGRCGGGAGHSPAAGIIWERRPLAPFLRGFMGALSHGSHGDWIHGGGENMALVAANSWVEVSLTS